MSSFVSWFVILGTVISLVGFILLLLMNRKGGRPGETTGHVYDGIEEYDNPLPAWWFWSFLLSILFSVAYLFYYPGLGNFEGLGKWTQINELEADQHASELKYAPLFAEYRKIPMEQLSQDEEVLKMGRRIYSNNCVMCHGSSATGSTGFPSLVDDEWLWGDDFKAIQHSIENGRTGAMPPWEAVLKEDGVSDVTSYVLSLAGRNESKESVDRGRLVYETYCQTCHGQDGKGNFLFGAPDMTNEIWLYGNSRSRIENVIAEGRNGVMPAFMHKLGQDKIRILAAYVKSLSDKDDSD